MSTTAPFQPVQTSTFATAVRAAQLEGHEFPRCANCVYHAVGRGNRTECRRHAQVYDSDFEDYRYPWITPEHFCGDWEAKEPSILVKDESQA